MENFLVGLYGSKSYEGGTYNMLAGFIAAVHDALESKGIPVKFMNELAKEGEIPNITISFNTSGFDAWDTTISQGRPHIMWGVNSPFLFLPAIEKFKDIQHFIYAAVSPVDQYAMNHFFPDITYLYLQHGYDPKLWYYDDTEKEYDLIYMSSLKDYSADIEALKSQLDPGMYAIFMEMLDYAMRNTNVSFWNIFNSFAPLYNYSIDEISFYYIYFLTLSYAVTYQKRIEMVKSLKDFNLKVWGDPLWEKYIEGKVEYMGSANLLEATEIVRKSRIVLHQQPMQTIFGSHERVLHAMASNSFVISDKNPQLKLSFEDKISFYNHNEIENLPDIVNEHLKNKEATFLKAQQGREIVLNNHTWAHRISLLMKLLLGTN
ncbi:MAG: glycosyltransferase [Cyanobacteriota bacterium]